MSGRSSFAPREYMTAAEIAALGLKHSPATERHVNRLAREQGWRDSGLARPRDGRGGGWEYHVSLLPDAAMAELVEADRRQANEAKGAAIALAAERELAEARPAAGRLNARQRAIMEARAALLTEVDRLTMTGARTRARAVGKLIDAIELGASTDPLVAASAVANERRRAPSRTQIYEWLKARDALGLIGLAPKLKRVKEALPPWFEGWLRFYALPAKPCITDALHDYLQTLPDPSKGPTYDQVRHTLGKLGPLERAAGREGKLAMRKRLAYVARDTSDLLPTSVYVADGKTFDAEIAHPLHGRPFRPEITSIIDAATRVCVGWSVDLDERTFGTAEALRHACSERGIPALFYTDRGPGYVSQAMVDPLVGFLGRAGITPIKALPRNAQAKGLIERLNQVYTPFAKRFATYLGDDMDPEARKLAYRVTRGELAAVGSSRTLPSWHDFTSGMAETIARYNARPHSELPRVRANGVTRHMTPQEAWAARCAEGFEPIVPDAAELEDMFRPWMIRRTRRACVELFGNSYFLLALEALDGEDVVVGYDIKNASQVWVRRIDVTPDGRQPGALIGVAEFEGNKRRYVPLSAEQAAMETRAKGRLRRLAKKTDAVEAELDGFRLLDLDPAPLAPLVSDAGSNRVSQFVPANDAPAAPHARPVFADDASFAAWLLAHPRDVRPSDAAYLGTLLQSAGCRDLFRSHTLDLDALHALTRCPA